MIIDGDVQCFPAGELWVSATSSVAAYHDLPEARQASDIQVQQVTWRGEFVTDGGRAGCKSRLFSQ